MRVTSEGQTAARSCRGFAVESNRSELGEVSEQLLQRIVLGKADCLVKAAGPVSRCDDIPQSNFALRKSGQTRAVVQHLEVFAKSVTDQSPELVGRVRIIFTRGQRRVARKAPKNEQSRIG